MDPDAAVREIESLLREGDWDEANESVGDLMRWLERGGFPPKRVVKISETTWDRLWQTTEFLANRVEDLNAFILDRLGRAENPLKDMPGGSVSGCIDLMKKTRKDITDPGAYCASIADRIEPGWRERNPNCNCRHEPNDLVKRVPHKKENQDPMYSLQDRRTGRFVKTTATLREARAQKKRRRGRPKIIQHYGPGGPYGGKTVSNARKMTKREFEQYFRDEVLPEVSRRYEQDGIPDKPARREAWNDTVDAFIQDGVLPESAYNWSHPRWLETTSPKLNPKNRKTNPSESVSKLARILKVR